MSLISLLPGGALLDELPETDQMQCDLALAEGRYWDASFDCPALRFVRGVFGGPEDEEDEDEEEQ